MSNQVAFQSLFGKIFFSQHEVDWLVELAQSVRFVVKQRDELLSISYSDKFSDQQWIPILEHEHADTLLEFRHLLFLKQNDGTWRSILAQRKWWGHGVVHTLPDTLPGDLKLYTKEDGRQVKVIWDNGPRFFSKTQEITDEILPLLQRKGDLIDRWTDLVQQRSETTVIAEYCKEKDPQFTAYGGGAFLLLGFRHYFDGRWEPATNQNHGGTAFAHEIVIPDEITTREDLLSWVTARPQGEGVIACWRDICVKIKTQVYYNVRNAVSRCGRSLENLLWYISGQDWSVDKKMNAMHIVWHLSTSAEKYSVVFSGRLTDLFADEIEAEIEIIVAEIEKAAQSLLEIIMSGDKKRIFSFCSCFGKIGAGILKLSSTEEILDKLERPYFFVQGIKDPTLLQQKRKKK